MSNRVFLEIAIGDRDQYVRELQAFGRAKEWLQVYGSTYGYSSINDLSSEDKDIIQDIYCGDPSLVAHGPILLTEPTPLPGGRVTIELFSKDCPKSCDNFKQLCMGDKIGKSSKKLLRYEGTRIFRVVKDFVLQGGDVTRSEYHAGVFGGQFHILKL